MATINLDLLTDCFSENISIQANNQNRNINIIFNFVQKTGEVSVDVLRKIKQ